MTETIHRILMAAGGTLTGLAGLGGVSDVLPLQAVAWIALIGGALTLAGNQIRVWWPSKPSAPAQ